MKKNGLGIVVATSLVVSLGSVMFALSIGQLKGNAQTDLSGDFYMEVDYESKDDLGEEDTLNNFEINVFEESIKDPLIVYFNEDVIDNSSYKELDKMAYVSGAYLGQKVYIKDGLVDKELAWNNAKIIMEYIYNDVDSDILTPYNIDKNNYSYKIERQYHKQNGVNYAVFMLRDDKIFCTIGICLDDGPKMTSFSRDGLIELYGGERAIPNEYLLVNWCSTTEQKETIYKEYFDKSKEIIEDVLGLASIKNEVRNIESISYFHADTVWSTVTFGYVLDNGLYVKVFYNRVNQMWDGYCIAGYHKDYYDGAK